ncbi:MAG: ATP-binding protein [Sedimenticola sp.]|nr:ATP-binding protein [Sedimenticola sp.]
MGLEQRLTGFDRRRLRRWLLLFFIALLIPSGVLVWYAYGQLKWEAFHNYRLQAEAFTRQIGRDLDERIGREQQRPFIDYAFLAAAGDAPGGVVQRSPLSAYPVKGSLPGVIGYFQVDDRGRLSTPLLPGSGRQAEEYGIDATGLAGRRALQLRLQQILNDNRLVATVDAGRGGQIDSVAGREVASRQEEEAAYLAPLPAASGLNLSTGKSVERKASVPAQSAFDELGAPRKRKKESAGTLGRVEDLQLDQRYEARIARSESDAVQSEVTARTRQQQQPQASVAEAESQVGGSGQARSRERLARPTGDGGEPLAAPIHTFENELDRFEFSLLDSGHFVLFRKVWRDGRRFIQGMLIERQPLLRSMIGSRFAESPLAAMSDLTVAYRGELFSTYGGNGDGASYRHASELGGSLLYRGVLPPPLAELELIFSVNHLPAGPGGQLITWVGASLLLVLCGGFYLMYRLALRQLELARQQQDFVSAVSHELKTPLTSIRMYAEMLREGWADEEKRRGYYDYIQQESERLTRLINNVLQLARMTRNELKLACRTLPVGELMESTRDKVATQVSQAGFELVWRVAPEAAGCRVRLDPDSFSQIMINLVDNGLKFAAAADTRRIEVEAVLERREALVFSVRDHGPGIPRDQMKKIFRLFYRPQSELTRETVGTGIGLALVAELAAAMGGRVDVVNRKPGALFRVTFPGRATDD